MMEALKMWCQRKMQRISWTEKRTDEDIFFYLFIKASRKKTLIDTIKRRK